MGTQLPKNVAQQPHQFLAHVYCGQPAGLIKTPLGKKVGLVPGHIVLDEDPAQTPRKGAQQPPHTLFDLCLYRWNRIPLGTEVGNGPGDFVLDEDLAPPQKGGGAPKFAAHVYCGQTAGWIKMALGMEVGLGPVLTVLDGDTGPTPKKGAEPPNFRPIFIVAKRLDASRCH